MTDELENKYLEIMAKAMLLLIGSQPNPMFYSEEEFAAAGSELCDLIEELEVIDPIGIDEDLTLAELEEALADLNIQRPSGRGIA